MEAAWDIPSLEELFNQPILKSHVSIFDVNLKKKKTLFVSGFVHGDLNEMNILMTEASDAVSTEEFGEMKPTSYVS